LACEAVSAETIRITKEDGKTNIAESHNKPMGSPHLKEL
jgi:hypothetical protein